MTIRISEYYDLFDVKYEREIIDYNNPTFTKQSSNQMDGLPDNVPDVTYNGIGAHTNTFRGFSNLEDISHWNAPTNNYKVSTTITGQHKAPQAIANVEVLENGDILCYPPNVSVPYWNKVIFRNFDYQIHKPDKSMYQDYIDEYLNDNQVKFPSYLKSGDDYKPSSSDAVTTLGKVYNYNEVPVFLKYDEYRSRSKVIFSSVDKTRNPDIEHKFGYQYGQMSPIKLNLSFSCNTPQRDGTYDYNRNLDKYSIDRLFTKCYWSIEWIYERESGN